MRSRLVPACIQKDRSSAGVALVLFAFAMSLPAHAATIKVNSLADSGSAHSCVLRDAIIAANAKTATHGCIAGTGDDTIVFSLTGAITLASSLPEVTDAKLTMTGPVSPGITIDGISGVEVIGVAREATLNLKHLKIAGGGGITNEGTLTVTNSTFSENLGLFGGGISNQGRLTVTNSTFSENVSELGGGGICNFDTLTVVGSTFADNGAAAGGGGISNQAGATLTVINSTFWGGDGSDSGGGGIDNDGTLAVTNSTFANNQPGEIGGGGISNIGPATFKGTILAANGGDEGVDEGGNCAGVAIVDAGYNISDDATCGFVATGSARNGDLVDPRLSSDGLADNGGPTQTIALLAGSPAIDVIPVADCADQASPPKSLTIDQRGMPRPDAEEDVCDIGAYESEETFAGKPGKKNCHGVSVSALSRHYGSLPAAALALGFPSVKALQLAIRAFCRG